MRKFLRRFSTQSKFMFLVLVVYVIATFYQVEPSTRLTRSNWGFWLVVCIQIVLSGSDLYDAWKNHHSLSRWDKVNLIMPLSCLLLIAILDRIIHQSWLLN
jgi:putative copper export protein